MSSEKIFKKILGEVENLLDGGGVDRDSVNDVLGTYYKELGQLTDAQWEQLKGKHEVISEWLSGNEEMGVISRSEKEPSPDVTSQSNTSLSNTSLASTPVPSLAYSFDDLLKLMKSFAAEKDNAQRSQQLDEIIKTLKALKSINAEAIDDFKIEQMNAEDRMLIWQIGNVLPQHPEFKGELKDFYESYINIHAIENSLLHDHLKGIKSKNPVSLKIFAQILQLPPNTSYEDMETKMRERFGFRSEPLPTARKSSDVSEAPQQAFQLLDASLQDVRVMREINREDMAERLAARKASPQPQPVTTPQVAATTTVAQPEGRIYLRVKQTAKMTSDKKLQDASVRIVAPKWVETELSKLSEKLQGKTFVFYEVEIDENGKATDKETKRSFTVNGPLTLTQLSMIARNEVNNTSGEIAFQNYPGIDREVVYALKDLVRHCVTVGTDVATHEGGYKVDLVKKKKVEKVYICDLAALQFQKNFNSGRLVLVGEKLPKGMLDDAIYQFTVGQKKPSLEECKNDTTGRFVKLNGALPQRIYCANDVGRNPPEELYFDTYAHSRFVQQDFVLAGLTLNALAEKNGDEINFKFLKYGAGFFAQAFDGDPEMDPNTQEKLTECLLQGAYDGLQELFAHNPSKIKRVEFPFYISESPSPKVLELKEKIEKLCEMNGRECGFERKDALHKTSAKYVTATTTTADPHAMAGNEMHHGSVDAAISENIQSKGNKYSPAINGAMQYSFGPLSPEQTRKNLLDRVHQFHGDFEDAILLEDKEIILDQLHTLVRQYEAHSLKDDPHLKELKEFINEVDAKYASAIQSEIDDLKASRPEAVQFWLETKNSNKSWLIRNADKMLASAMESENIAKLLSTLAKEDDKFAAKLLGMAFKDPTDKNTKLRQFLLADLKKLDREGVEKWTKLNASELLHDVRMIKLLAETNNHFADIFLNQKTFASRLSLEDMANILSKHDSKQVYVIVKDNDKKIELLGSLATYKPEMAQKISQLLEISLKTFNTEVMSKWGVNGVSNANEVKDLYRLINKLEVLKAEFHALNSPYENTCNELLATVKLRLESKALRALSREEVEACIKLNTAELKQDASMIKLLAENNYHFAHICLNDNKLAKILSADDLISILVKYERNHEQYYSLLRAVVVLAKNDHPLAAALLTKRADLFSAEQLNAILNASSQKSELLALIAQHNPTMAKRVSELKVKIHQSTNKHSEANDYRQSFPDFGIGLAELTNINHGRNDNEQQDNVAVTAVDGFEKLSRSAQKNVLKSVFARVSEDVASEPQGSTALACISYVRKDEAGKTIACVATANLADSSTFVIKRNKKTGEVSCVRINTQLHKATDELERQRVQEKGGIVGSDERLNGKIAVARAFGDNKPGLAGFMSSEPDQDYLEIELSEDEEIDIISACDGLTERNKAKQHIKPQSNETNGVDVQLVQELVTDILRQDPNCSSDVLSQKLVETARDVCGSTDNISVITRRITPNMVGKPAVMMGVFDGHGGPKVSQQVAEVLPVCLQENVDLAVSFKTNLSSVLAKYRTNNLQYQSILKSVAELANKDPEFAAELFTHSAVLFEPELLHAIANANGKKIELLSMLGKHSPEMAQKVSRLLEPSLNKFTADVLGKWAVNPITNAQQIRELYAIVVNISELKEQFQALKIGSRVEDCDHILEAARNRLGDKQLIELAKSDYAFALDLFTNAKTNEVALGLTPEQTFEIINSHENKEALLNAVGSYNSALRNLTEASIKHFPQKKLIADVKRFADDKEQKISYEVKQIWVERNQQFLVESKNVLLKAALADYSLALLILHKPTLANQLSQTEIENILHKYANDSTPGSSNRKLALLAALNNAELEKLTRDVDGQSVNNSDDVKALYKVINEIAELKKKYGEYHKTTQAEECEKLLDTAIKKMIGEQFFKLAKSDYAFALDLFTNARANEVVLGLTPERTFEIINAHENTKELLDAVGRFNTSRRNAVEALIQKQAMVELPSFTEKGDKLRWIEHSSVTLQQNPQFILEAALADKFIALRLLGDRQFAEHLNDEQIVNILSKYLTAENKVDKNIFWAALKAVKDEGFANRLIDQALKVVSDRRPQGELEQLAHSLEKNTSLSSEKKKTPFVLLDVDQTIDFNGELNTNLIAALKKAGITEVYFFTDMRIDAEHVRMRKEFIEAFQQSGIKVVGVTTSMDFLWHLPDSEIDKLYDLVNTQGFSLSEKAQSPEKEAKTKAAMEKFKQALRDELPETIKLLQGKSENQRAPGEPFEECRDLTEPEFKKFNKRSFVCKILIDLASSPDKYLGHEFVEQNGLLSRNYSHPKGILYEQLLSHKGDEIESCILFDDNEKALASVAAANQVVGERGVLLSTVNAATTGAVANPRSETEYSQAINLHNWRRANNDNPEPFKTLLDHQAELQPYWDAVINALNNIENNPKQFLYKLRNFEQALNKLNLGEVDQKMLDAVIGMYGGISDAKVAKALIYVDYYMQQSNQTPFLHMFRFSAVPREFDIVVAHDEPLMQERTKQFTKSEQKFETLLQKNIQFPKGLGVTKVASQLRDIVRVARLSPDHLVDYIIKNPQSAHYFFSKETLYNNASREKICRNPDLLHKLIDSGRIEIWNAMQETRLLESSHLKKVYSEVQIQTLKDKLQAAPQKAEAAIQKAEQEVADVERKAKMDAARDGNIGKIIELAEEYYAKQLPEELKEFAISAAGKYAEIHMRQFGFSMDNKLEGQWSTLENDHRFMISMSTERSKLWSQRAVEIINHLSRNDTSNVAQIERLVNLLASTNSPAAGKALLENKNVLSLLIQKGHRETLEAYYKRLGSISELYQGFNEFMEKGLSSLTETPPQMTSSPSRKVGSEITDEESLETGDQALDRILSGADSSSISQVRDEPDSLPQKKEVISSDDSTMKALQEQMKALGQQSGSSKRNKQDCLDAIKKIKHPFYRELLEAAIKKQTDPLFEFPTKEKIESFVTAANALLQNGMDYKAHNQLINDQGLPYLTVKPTHFEGKLHSSAPTEKPKETRQRTPETLSELEAARKRVDQSSRSSGPKTNS